MFDWIQYVFLGNDSVAQRTVEYFMSELVLRATSYGFSYKSKTICQPSL